MIKVNELMVGNWTLYPHTQKEPFQIKEPRQIELSYLLDPIPLTPEILEKCGFEKYRDNLNKIDENGDGIGFEIGEDGACRNIVIFGSHDFIYIGNEIQNLHQLQNLYFCLTGEELDVKL